MAGEPENIAQRLVDALLDYTEDRQLGVLLAEIVAAVGELDARLAKHIAEGE